MAPETDPHPRLAAYLQDLHAAYGRASQVQPPEVHSLQIADVCVTLRFASSGLADAFLPALAHLAVACPPSGGADVTFDLWDSAATAVWPPRPPFTVDDYRRYGQRAVAYGGALALMAAPHSKILFAYDRAARHGYFWTADAAQLSIYEQAAPLQTLFHWALAPFGWQFIHAAAVGTEQGGVLLIGASGAGKSTTALSCLGQADIKYLSDDKCLVRLDPTPQVCALYTSAKLKADMLERLPHFRPLLAGWDEHAKGGKGLVLLYPAYADHMITAFPIKALLLPAVTNRATAALCPVAPGAVFRQLGPSTVIWLPGAEADNYRFTAELTRRLPCYQLDLALEPARNLAAIRGLLDEWTVQASLQTHG